MLFLCYSRCSTCKKAQKWLDEQGIAYTQRDIKEDNPTLQELETWHQASALPLKKILQHQRPALPRPVPVEKAAGHDPGGAVRPCWPPMACWSSAPFWCWTMAGSWWAFSRTSGPKPWAEGRSYETSGQRLPFGGGLPVRRAEQPASAAGAAAEAAHLHPPSAPSSLAASPPRVPAERQGNRVVTRDGDDVTEAFVRGTAEVLRLADLYHCRAALLKERSPSCGSGQIYDGTFTKTLTLGDGLTAQMLKKHGITVYGESQIEELIGSRPFFFSI